MMFEIFLFPEEISFCSVDLPSYVTAPFQINRTLWRWCLCSRQTKNMRCQQRLWGQGCEGLNIALAMTPMMERKRSFSASLCFCVLASKKRSLSPAPALCGTITMRHIFKLSCFGKENEIKLNLRDAKQYQILQDLDLEELSDRCNRLQACSDLEPSGHGKTPTRPKLLQ